MADTITITLTPSAAVYISKEDSDDNKSGNNYLLCGYGSTTGKCYYTYLKFPIQSNIPAGSKITSATLSVYSYNGDDDWTSPIDIVCKRVTSSWNQSTLVWGTSRPTATSTNQVTKTQEGNGKWYTFTITAMVQDMLDATTNYGLVLRQSDNDSSTSTAKTFRKNTEGYEPKLEIKYEPIKEGSVIIYTSETSKKIYKPYIYNGTKWVPCNAYVYNNGWKITTIQL